MNSRLNIICPINKLGYGGASYNIVRELDKLTYVHLTILGQRDQESSVIDSCVARPHFKDAPCLRIYHQFALKEFIGKGKHVGFPIFELDTFTDVEKHHLNSVDELFVCSDWAKSIVEQNGIQTPVKVVPLGIDPAVFNVSRSKPQRDKTIFFTCGKWEVRKGHPELAEAFHRAFKHDDKVELWLMCNNPFYQEHITNQFKNMFVRGPMGHKVVFIPRVESHLQVAKIMGQAHVGVFPAKAEGWNLELLEMMAIGKPVITTNYSGHTQFANKENSCLIQPTGLQQARDGIWFNGQGNWCTFNVDDLVEAMKSYHDMNMNGNLAINNNGIATADKFTWENTAKKIHELLC